jgi:hypothetical protein
MYKITWDFGDLDCRDPDLRARLGMSLSDIMNCSEVKLHNKLCIIYGLPTTSKNKFSIRTNGFKPYSFTKVTGS